MVDVESPDTTSLSKGKKIKKNTTGQKDNQLNEIAKDNVSRRIVAFFFTMFMLALIAMFSYQPILGGRK